MPRKSDTQPEGTGFRPAFHALWHLPMLGVVKDLKDYSGDPWDNADKDEKATRIAIIDTPVDHDHPNLAGAIDIGLMRDFSQGGNGAFVLHNLSDENMVSREALLAKIENSKKVLDEAIKEEAAWIESKKDEDRPKGVPLVPPSRLYGAHGTAVAGLIGARPACVKLRRPMFTPKDMAKTPQVVDLELPYCGINPFCRIIPVSVTANPSPEMVLGALEYTKLIEPDIVVIADSWDGALDSDGVVTDAWKDVDDALTDLCLNFIVLCAAGNDALDQPVYPASRCNDKTIRKIDGKINEINAPGPWAVGACGTDGKDLTYSPVQSTIVGHGGWMIKTLSTEVPIFDRERTRIDPWEIEDDLLGVPKNSEDFPLADIVTTDLPGRAGYNPSPYEHRPGPDEEQYEIASLFCRFAGTSAAVAIAAGLVSLLPSDSRRSTGRPPGKKPSEKGLEQLFDVELAKKLFKK
ncbi:Subtilase family protein [Roseivivax lentus]|uniref:Subtilase family protein n=1 Tax=Roseivivax lentus TaxID=633194 RepID=A0A1N7LX67_9RHOB|nr:S8/S53 family peptidase [Roseivivax lentus]SIS78435.1 Subtilase family protein [Roseivivax lentus]